MCLEVKKGAVRRTAKRDILVWKALARVTYLGDKSRFGASPYHGMHYYEGETNHSLLGRPNHNEVGLGLHSLKERTACYDNAEYAVQMVIPKGARYYFGKFGGDPSYCSNRLEWRKGAKVVKSRRRP